MREPPSNRRALTVLSPLVLALLCGSRAGGVDYKYEPREQACAPTTGYDGTLPKQIAFSTSSAPDLHMIAREWKGTDENFGRGVHYVYDDVNGWSTGEVFTPDQTGSWPDGRHSTDFRFVVGGNDSLHVVFEAKNYDPNVRIFIGYKDQSDTAQWSPSAWPESLGVGHSPRIALWDDDGEESVHVVFAGGVPDTSGEFSLYNRRDADGTWDGTSYITDEAFPRRSLGSILVDSDGVLHLIADRKTFDGLHDRIHVKHVSGTPPGTGGNFWNSPSIDTLDSYIEYQDPLEAYDQCGVATGTFLAERSERIQAVWSRLEEPVADVQERVIAFKTKLVSDSTWGDLQTLSRVGDGLNSGAPTIAVDGGTVHVFWQNADTYGRRRVMHRFSSDPADSMSWSPIVEVFPDVAGGARRPTAVVASGTSYVAGYDGTRGIFRTGAAFTTGIGFAPSTVATGVYFLEDDLLVPAGEELLLQEGVVLSFADSLRYGGFRPDTTRAGLIVRGAVQASGTSSDPVMLSSPGGSPGSWPGPTFGLAGAYSSYGYLLSVEPLSQMEHVIIENADIGVRISDHIAPSLKDVTFSNIATGWEVYLDSCDVVVPSGWDSTGSGTVAAGPKGRWEVSGPLDVVAADAVRSGGDIGYGNSGRVDLIFEASECFLDGSGGAIEFGPETTSGTGDNWGGVALYETEGCVLDGVSIGYAKNPLFLYFPDSTRVERSTVHHFAETGIWVDGTSGDGVVLDSVTVDRGTGLATSAGDLGILIEEADQVTVNKTTVDLEGLDSTSGGTGISVYFTPTFCNSTPSSLRTLRIQNCLVQGPSNPQFGEDEYRGIATNWVCGELDERDIDILNNVIDGYFHVGMDFYQTANVQVSCNHVLDCRNGVDIYRDSQPTGTAVRFKRNRLEALTKNENYFAVRTNDSVKTKLGPSNTLRGSNELKVNVDSTKFIREDDSTSADTLNATYNYWYAGGQLSSQGNIETRLAPSGYSIDVSNLLTGNPAPDSCLVGPTASQQQEEGRALLALQQGTADDRPEGGWPAVLSLGPAYPNPLRTGVTMDLAVPEDRTGRYTLKVYDVRGRRIQESEREISSAGRYEVVWDGRGNRIRAAAGVYFLRLKGPNGFQETRKVTLLR